MNYYVFQVSDQSKYGKQRKAQEVFDFLVHDRSAWGFGYHTPNRKAIQPGDRALFYLTGADNQIFVGAATLKSGAYKDTSNKSKDWFLDPETLRIDLEDVTIFPSPISRKNFLNIEWRPAQGGSSKISEKDYLTIIGKYTPEQQPVSEPEEMEFVLEKYLEEFIIGNWDKINFGEKLSIFKDENDNIGEQYLAGDAGYIDILTLDKDNNFVVIELKKGRKNDEVIGQTLRYITWVEENLAEGKKVRALIVVRERDKKLEYALKQIRNKVAVKLYKVSFALHNY
jgi:hypothetical protein